MVLDEGDGGQLLSKLFEDNEAVDDFGLSPRQIQRQPLAARPEQSLAADVDLALQLLDALRLGSGPYEHLGQGRVEGAGARCQWDRRVQEKLVQVGVGEKGKARK